MSTNKQPSLKKTTPCSHRRQCIYSKYTYLFLCLLYFLPQTLHAQIEQIFPAFILEGESLSLATVGGLSAPQFNEVDLNNDGIKDLYIFDKIGQVGLTFLNGGTPNKVDYSYAPAYIDNFPDLVEWVLLRDYNGDGIQDIFAHSSTPGVPGMEVYTGYYDENNEIAFRSFPFHLGAFNIIYYPGSNGFNNLYVSNVDYPSVDDIDGDGDLDIVTFNIAGGIVELYTNQSIERGFGLDSLQYILEDNCWGRFYESGISLELDLADDVNSCAGRFRSPSSEQRSGALHAGSTVTTIDMDNDGDKEVLLGDISFTNLNLAFNGGDRSQAFMNEQDITFPRNTTPVNIPLFPAAYILDINNDGLKDLVAAPNLGNDIGETYNVAWYYANINTNENPVFDYRYKDLLVGDMLDFGTGAHPVFVDYNADGLQDLVIGNKSYFVPGGDKNARIFLFENIGTSNTPKYELKDDDYLGLNAFSNSSWRFAPTFGDLDNDGDLDVLIGEEFGNLFYGENIAGPNQPFEFAPIQFGYQDLDIGQVSKPQIVDINKDGLVDLVIGERNGNVNLYENIGTPTNPQFDFTPTNKDFGGVDVRDAGFVTAGYSSPVLLQIDGRFQLFAGTQSGSIKRYSNIEENINGEFLPIANGLGTIKVGAETHLSFADIDGDDLLEVVVGNIRGGISFYKTSFRTTPTSTSSTDTASISWNVQPNPVKEILQITLPLELKARTISLYNTIGQLVLQQDFSNQIKVAHLSKGVYFLEVRLDKGMLTRKILKY